MTRKTLTKLSNRRGSALMLVLLFTLALGGLAISAIYMNGTTTIVSKLYDRERDYRYAAEWALAMGKSQISRDTTLILPDSGYVTLASNLKPTTVGGQAIPLVSVDLYAGLSGVTSGQYGKAVSLVAVASDSSGARHVRRLELLAENFAVYAVFVDQWQAGLCYTTGEIIRGRAHSNTNWVSCGPPGPVYTDSVSAVTSITGSAQYQKGNYPNFVRINYPTNAWLTKMIGLANTAGYNITPVATATRGGSRMEFVAVDLNGDGDVTDPTEGFFKIYDGNVGNLGLPAGADTFVTKSQWPYNVDANTLYASGLAANQKYRYVIRNQCGASYTYRSIGGVNYNWFIPVDAHNTASLWFRDSMKVTFQRQGQPLAVATANADALRNQTVTQILTRAGARCYPAGDPHLMPSERFANPDLARWGGEDSTFTAVQRSGAWRPYPGGAIGAFTGATNRQLAEQPYLWPLHRALNPNFQGVIYVNGDIYMSGVVRGRATVFAQSEVKFIDDVTYTSPPGTLSNICTNLLGILTGDNTALSDNAINRPKFINGTAAGTARFLDDNQDFFLHGVSMSGVYSATGGWYTELYGVGANAGRLCTSLAGFNAQTSGGCISQAGGVIQRKIYATFSGNYTGFGENRVKDPCLDFDSPPFFPLTGRYKDNEFYEIDPQQFLQMGVANFYRRLQGT
ncbi:MAG TPA: hypothetical protein VH762_12235 [Gemmatimonadaceae bacterium]|jgi:hypothetical protein